MKILISLLLFAPLYLSAQLSAFENLAGSTWISEGKQLGGHEGKTVKEISWGLDGQIIKVKTFTTDPKTLEFGLRNEGVRIQNSETNTLEFYEFDKSGGVTKGIVIVEGANLHYEYPYGELTLRDSWIFLSSDKYEYTVASVINGKQAQLYHKGVFQRSN